MTQQIPLVASRIIEKLAEFMLKNEFDKYRIVQTGEVETPDLVYNEDGFKVYANHKEECLKIGGIGVGMTEYEIYVLIDAINKLKFQREEAMMEEGMDEVPQQDNVNHPKHYTSHPSGIECIEITKYYDFCIGNAIKYLWRQGLKHEEGMDDNAKQIEDLEKAKWYIEKKISMLNGTEEFSGATNTDIHATANDNQQVQAEQEYTDNDIIQMFTMLSEKAFRNALLHGFHESNDNDGEKIALMHSELSEALDALRNGNQADKHCQDFTSLEVELADCIIRILDYAGLKHLDIGGALVEKMKYNESREYKHGKAF